MEEPQSSSDWGDDRSQQTVESLRALRDQSDQTFNDHRERVGEIETRLNEQLELIAEELTRVRLADEQALAASAEQAATLEEVQHSLAAKEAEVTKATELLTAQSQEFEAELAERDEELEQVLELGEEESQEKESLQQELDSARQALEVQKAQEGAQSLQARDELTEVEQQFKQLEEQSHALQEQHQSQQAELDLARQKSQSAQEQHEQAATTLAEAERRIEQLLQLQQDGEQTDQEHEQIRRKFELALADVHKLKRENAELREELLSRPEANDQESPELVSLRAERDALAERVSELENVPAPAQADGQQEFDDLQRRFELAVDDVRQLKQEKTDLSQRLETALTSNATSSQEDFQDGPLDWQAQKARLLATLDAEDQGSMDESRREERATLEGTISITDRVVAEKDALLAKRESEVVDLREQLEARPASEDLEKLREQLTAEILGDDEAIQKERTRLQKKQEQLEDKLREAELDISVQRATLAREQASLEHKLADLPATDPEADTASTGKPRRRWLSALGIKDEEEG